MHVRSRRLTRLARGLGALVLLAATRSGAAEAAPDFRPDRPLMKAWQEGRRALAGDAVAPAQALWDRLLPPAPGQAYAVVLARPCEGELLVALAARTELAPLWVTGPHEGCHGLLWGLFATEEEARTAGAQVPARYLEGEPEVIALQAPLAAMDVSPPSVQLDQPLVAPPAAEPVPEPPAAAAPVVAAKPPAAQPPVTPPPATQQQQPTPPVAPERPAPTAPPTTTKPAPAPTPDPSLSAPALFALGNEAYARGDYPAAITAFEAALVKDPINARTLNNLGTAQLVSDLPEDAERSFRTAVNLDPGYARAWLNLGTALYAQGRGLEALPMLEKAVELDPRNLDAHSNLAALLVELRRWQSARRVLQEALVIFPSEALLLRQLEQVEEQIALRGEVEETDAPVASASPRAEEPPRATGKSSPCAADLSRTRRIVLAGQLFEEGRSAYGRGQHESAEWAFERALECDPTSPAILNHLGAARLAAGRASSAAGAFELALQHDPAFLEASVNLALAQFQMGHCDDSLATLRELAARQPGSGEAAFQLGRMLHRCGRSGEAPAELERAQRLLPADPRPRQLLDRLAAERVGAPR